MAQTGARGHPAPRSAGIGGVLSRAALRDLTGMRLGPAGQKRGHVFVSGRLDIALRQGDPMLQRHPGATDMIAHIAARTMLRPVDDRAQ